MTSHDLMLQKLDGIRKHFLTRLEASQDVLTMCVVGIKNASAANGHTRDQMHAATAVLHKISGSAGSLGFAELGALAHTSEHAVFAHLDSAGHITEDARHAVVQILNTFIQACDQLTT